MGTQNFKELNNPNNALNMITYKELWVVLSVWIDVSGDMKDLLHFILFI